MTNINAEDIELKRFKSSPDKMESYRQAKKLLVDSGILAVFRNFGRPYSVDGGASPYRSSYMAGVAEGYNKCLDDLFYFEEMYLTETASKKAVPANFGARSIALSKGDLSKEDLERLGL